MKTKYSSPTGKEQLSTQHSFRWCLLALFLALAGTGCNQASTAADGIDPAGKYNLVSVNGKQVPCVITHERAAVTVKSGTFTIGSDGTCSTKTTFSVASGSDVHREVTATYTREGTKLTMKWNGAGTTTGNLDGNTFTMNNEDMVLAYQK